MSETMEEMKKYVKTVVPENSLLIVQVPESEVQKTSQDFSSINVLLDAMGIRLLVAPDKYKFTVVKAPKSGKKMVEFINSIPPHDDKEYTREQIDKALG